MMFYAHIQTNSVPTSRPQLVAERKAPPPPRPPITASKSSSDTRGTPQKPDALPPAPRTKPDVATPANASSTPTRQVERRISTMNEAQIMDKLRSVVSTDDPSEMYHRIKKVGQGCVSANANC